MQPRLIMNAFGQKKSLIAFTMQPLNWLINIPLVNMYYHDIDGDLQDMTADQNHTSIQLPKLIIIIFIMMLVTWYPIGWQIWRPTCSISFSNRKHPSESIKWQWVSRGIDIITRVLLQKWYWLVRFRHLPLLQDIIKKLLHVSKKLLPFKQSVMQWMLTVFLETCYPQYIYYFASTWQFQ